MKLVAVNPHFKLYLVDSGDYVLEVFDIDKGQKIIFDLDNVGVFNGEFDELSKLNRQGIVWAQMTI